MKITYNDVTLPYTDTSKFDQRSEYDESSTDRCYTVFDIQTQCVVHLAYLSQVAPDLAGTSASLPEVMRAVRGRLLAQRKTLSVTFNGQELIPAQTAGVGLVDAKNGPQPQEVTIFELTSASFFVGFRVVAYYWENNDVAGGVVTNRPGNNVLYNRWEDSLDIDGLNFSRRTRTGVFKIRSDNVDGKIAAEIMTQMCVVGIPAGFLRANSRYTVSKDGLSLAYTVVDEEQFKMPPAPAYKAEGSYTESSSKMDARRYAEVRVVLKGDKITDQARLVQAAVAVATNKLAINGAPLTGALKEELSILQSASIRIGMWSNEVECVLRVMFPTSKRRIKGVAFLNRTMCFTPLVDGINVPPPKFPLLGTASRLLQAAAYYDPSISRTVLNADTGQLSTGVEPGRGGVQAE